MSSVEEDAISLIEPGGRILNYKRADKQFKRKRKRKRKKKSIKKIGIEEWL